MLLLIKITFHILSQNKEQKLTFSIINLCSEVIRKLEVSALSLGSLCAFYQGLAEELEAANYFCYFHHFLPSLYLLY